MLTVAELVEIHALSRTVCNGNHGYLPDKIAFHSGLVYGNALLEFQPITIEAARNFTFVPSHNESSFEN